VAWREAALNERYDQYRRSGVLNNVEGLDPARERRKDWRVDGNIPAYVVGTSCGESPYVLFDKDGSHPINRT